METYILAAVAFCVLFAGMAVGVIVARKPLKGTCGGLGNFKDSDGTPFCDACAEPCADLKREMRRQGHSEEEIEQTVPRNPDCHPFDPTTSAP